jgi:hypothetical protein
MESVNVTLSLSFLLFMFHLCISTLHFHLLGAQGEA